MTTNCMIHYMSFNLNHETGLHIYERYARFENFGDWTVRSANFSAFEMWQIHHDLK